MPPWLGADAAGARGIARFLDLTLLRPEATSRDVMRLADEAAELGAAAVCVNGGWVRRCAERLAGTGVRVAATVCFPLGAGSSDAKACEARAAVEDGAAELDMVMAIGLGKEGAWQAVAEDVRAVVAAAGAAAVKVIVESAALSPQELDAACAAAVRGGAAFVKSSTGFHPAGGATADAVRRMRAAVGPEVGVKAAGGIRTAAHALALLAAGANRLGTSSTVGLAGILGGSAPALSELLAR